MDDLDPLRSAISLHSKIQNSSFPQEENSLSRIIREQAVNYEEQYAWTQWKEENCKENWKKSTNTEQKKKYCDANTVNPENGTTKQHFSKGRKQQEISASHQPHKKDTKETGKTAKEGMSSERKGNILVFDDEKKPHRHSNNSKKQKRAEKQFLIQQKTKKIQHQNVEKYQNSSLKKQSPTRIKRHQEKSQQAYNCLELSSRNNSDSLAEWTEERSMAVQIEENYRLMIAQLKEQISIVKMQYMEAERIDYKKAIAKLEAEIRRTKISFRGGPNSANIEESCNLTSNDDKARKKINALPKSIQSKIKRERAEGDLRSLIDYGMGSTLQGQPLKQRLKKLQETMTVQQNNENKYASKLGRLQKKYETLQKNMLKIDESLKIHGQREGESLSERFELLKERITFLRNELKGNRSIFCNKIKRLKNENTILANEAAYISRQIDQIQIDDAKATPRISKKEKGEKTTKQNLLIFDESEVKNHQKERPIKTIPNAPKEPPKGSFNEVKSMQSVNSLKSLNSKPSLGSYKSTKIESTENKRSIELQNPIRNKAKISSPHHLAPTAQLKQVSILKRFSSEQSRGFGLHKKSTSLDIAFKELQQKYSKHMQEPFQVVSDEYYK